MSCKLEFFFENQGSDSEVCLSKTCFTNMKANGEPDSKSMAASHTDHSTNTPTFRWKRPVKGLATLLLHNLASGKFGSFRLKGDAGSLAHALWEAVRKEHKWLKKMFPWPKGTGLPDADLLVSQCPAGNNQYQYYVSFPEGWDNLEFLEFKITLDKKIIFPLSTTGNVKRET